MNLEQCAKRNKSVTERQTLQDSTYMKYLIQSDSQNQRVTWWLTEAVGGWLLINGCKVSVKKDEYILEVCYRTLYLESTILCDTLKNLLTG